MNAKLLQYIVTVHKFAVSANFLFGNWYATTA